MDIKQYLIRISLIIMIIISDSSCTHRYTERNYKKPEVAPAVTLHGEFCGPLHPNTDAGSTLDNLIVLAKIKPRDNLDEACQRHDICYELFGFGNRDCDKSLVNEVAFIKFQATNESAHCELVKSTIMQLRQAYTPKGDLSFTLGDLFAVTGISYAVTGMSYLSAGATGVIGSIEENILFPISKYGSILNAINSNQESQTIELISNYDRFCNDSDEKNSINLKYYNIYFLDTLLNSLFIKNYLSKFDLSNLRSYYLPVQLSQTDYNLLWHSKDKILGPSQDANPVIFKSWPILKQSKE